MANADTAKRCPKCGLYNPATAERCDCGYPFEAATGAMDRARYDLYSQVARLLRSGSPAAEVAKELGDLGLDDDTARLAIQQVIDLGRQTRGLGVQSIGIGIALVVLGLGITATTYVAAVQIGTGFFLAAWGAILVGLVRTIRGFGLLTRRDYGIALVVRDWESTSMLKRLLRAVTGT